MSESLVFFPSQLFSRFVFQRAVNILCQGDISHHQSTYIKLPHFMLCILKQSSESGYQQKLLNGTKQKIFKEQMQFKLLSLPDTLKKSIVPNWGHEGLCACTCVLKWVAMQPCVHVCVYGGEREREKETGGSLKSPCGVSVGRHCGVSSSACGIPSVYPSTSCPSKEAWNTLRLPWQETRARSALWLTSWPSAKPWSHDSFRSAQGGI